MKPAKLSSLVVLALAASLSACGSGSSSTTSATTPTNQTPSPTPPPSPGTTNGENNGSAGLSAETQSLGIEGVPTSLSNTYSSALNFDRYTKVVAPNGKPIHLIAQNQVTENQIVRSRNILQHYLTDFPGSQYGADKSAVANKMADNGAILLLLNGVDDGSNPGAELNGQPLYAGEMQVEGHQWYMQQDYMHRDASFEEILHLVHDYGIGVDQNPTFIGALPDFQAEIRAAQVDAQTGNIWGMGAADWIAELSAENSLSQEYLAAVIDVYYGLWGANTEFPDAGMYSVYVAKVRSDMEAEDPAGAALVNNKFFHPYLTYDARIDASFDGEFSLKFDPNLPYSHASRYLKDVTLTGSNPSNVVINQLDNQITGNDAENTVVFSGISSEYRIDRQGDKLTVTDLQDNRDGSNTLYKIERLRFTDTTIDVSSI